MATEFRVMVGASGYSPPSEAIVKTARISIPVDVLDELQRAAHARGLRSPQALIREYIREGLRAHQSYAQELVTYTWEQRIALRERRAKRLRAKGTDRHDLKAERLEAVVQIMRERGPASDPDAV